MADPITDYYADNPVEILDKNQRVWYDPDVLLLFKQRALFSNVITYVKNLNDVRATSMVTTQILPPHGNYNALATRQLWLPAMHVDSRQVEITFSHHGGKVALHDYDELVTYWRANGTEGLRRILNQVLGQHIIEVHDYLARNAFLQGAMTTGYTLYAGDATSFNDIGVDDTFVPEIAADIQLGMKYREVADAVNPAAGPDSSGNPGVGAVVCYTTPGVIFDIQRDPDWIEAKKYADAGGLFRYEVGLYKGVRFVESPRLTLWNCGAITAQAPINAARYAGDGSPGAASKIDGVYTVGQETTVTHNIALGAFGTGSIADIAVGDIISIGTSRTSSLGVTNGVNPFDGKLHTRRVVAKDAGAGTLQLDRPLMEDFATDLGAGVYGYVTKGFNVHASIFVGAPQAIVTGVAAPIRLHTPPPIDDLEAIYRYSWNDRMGHQPYTPEAFELVLSAGSVRVKGPRTM